MQRGVTAAQSMQVGMPMPSNGSDEQQHTPCRSPAVVCCQAMTSCGLSVQLARSILTADEFSRDDQLPAIPFRTPLDRVTPPEPPPPKA
jgi:hypothetical protein